MISVWSFRIAFECSKCAARPPSLVLTVQPSLAWVILQSGLADHRLNGNGHAGHKAWATALMAVVGAPRGSSCSSRPVPWPTNSRTTEKPAILAVALHRIADITDAVASLCPLDALVQSCLGHIQQALCFQVVLPTA